MHLIDPNPPGAGVHSPDQPDHLLMNTVAGQVTMFRTGDSAVAGRPISGPSLADWAGAAEHTYLPRAMLGRYLTYAYQRIRQQAPDSVTIYEHRATAETVRALRDRSWVLRLSDGSIIAADFVFLTTGHSTNHPTQEDHLVQEFISDHRRANPRLRYVRNCYPLRQLDTIAAGSRVAVRGMGLSSVDTVAALTVGRGGRFIQGPDGDLVYRPSGDEPRMYVYSRSGRIFWPRAVHQKTSADLYRPSFLTTAQLRELRMANGQLDFERHVLPLLRADMRTAAESVRPGTNPTDVDAILRPHEPARSRSGRDHQTTIVGFLVMDERRAAEGNLGNPIKAATDSLRDMRDSLRSVIEHRGLTPTSHQRFNQVYGPILNAVAAGPPVSRSREWRALFASGLLRVGAGPGAGVRADPDLAEFVIDGGPVDAEPATRCDVVVGASVDPFLPEWDTSPLTRSLLSGGHARPFGNDWFRPGGFDIDTSGRLIGADGEARPNIVALGHPTEGAHYFTNMLPAPGVDSRMTADAAAAVEAMADHLLDAGHPPNTDTHRDDAVASQGATP